MSLALTLLAALSMSLAVPFAALGDGQNRPFPANRKAHGQGEPVIDAAKDSVRLLLFTKLHPRNAVVRSHADATGAEASWILAAQGSALVVDGEKASAPFTLDGGLWRVSFEDGTSATVEGSLSVTAGKGELRFVATVGLESYVARTVASETVPGTPMAALEAQAVVARSYALTHGGKGHHGDADLCDLAHCQVASFKDGAMDEAHLKAAAAAALNTRGLVLRLPSGQVAAPLFHASCGGATSAASSVFDGRDETGAGVAHDPECALETWSARIPTGAVWSVFKDVWGKPSLDAPSSSPFAGVSLRRDEGGRVVQLVDLVSGKALSGEAFVRRLGASVGYGRVPSANFRVLKGDGGTVLLSGRGRGHGVGLCQAGASAMAREKKGFREILARYFPRASVAALH